MFSTATIRSRRAWSKVLRRRFGGLHSINQWIGILPFVTCSHILKKLADYEPSTRRGA